MHVLPPTFKRNLLGVAKAMQEQLQKEIRIIAKRTSSGVDVDGQAFTPYSPKYAAFKRASGRSGKVDLTWTGNMLAAMGSKVKVIGETIIGIISFIPAQAVKARANMRTRNFFGLSKEQLTRITKAMKEAIRL